MTPSTPPESGQEQQPKTIEQFKSELDVLARQHRAASVALTFANKKDRTAKQQELATVMDGIEQLEEQAFMTLDDKDWEEFAKHRDSYIEIRETQAAGHTIKLHRRSFGRRLVDVTKGMAMGTAEIAGHGVRAATTLTAEAAEHVAGGAVLTVWGIMRGSYQAILHIMGKTHTKRKVA